MIGHTVLSVWEVGIVATLLALVLGWRTLHKTGDRRWLRHVMATALNRNIWWSGFLQALALSFCLAIGTMMLGVIVIGQR